MPRVILLTSTHLRHQFVANLVAERLELVGLWQEKKAFDPEKYAGTPEELTVIQKHFQQRDASEKQYFGTASVLRLSTGTVHHVVDAGTINDPVEVEAMRSLGVDILLVFGTAILKQGIIDAFKGNIINIHLGLSPYYRGSGTNFWPLVNGEPEYVGATIHYLDAGIDTGAIIGHVRPDIAESDGPHDIGNKTIIAAAEGLAAAALAHAGGQVQAVKQEGGGKLYQRKDFSAAAVRTMYENFEKGMISAYLQDKTARDARLSLVSLPS